MLWLGRFHRNGFGESFRLPDLIVAAVLTVIRPEAGEEELQDFADKLRAVLCELVWEDVSQIRAEAVCRNAGA